jgi:toxin ParE1/3/4
VIVRVLPAAEGELADAARWYESQRRGLGHDLIAAFVAAVMEIEEHPRRYPRTVLPTSTDRELRGYRLTRFPYSIAYEVLAGEAVVLAFAHAARRPGFWFDRHPGDQP